MTGLIILAVLSVFFTWVLWVARNVKDAARKVRILRAKREHDRWAAGERAFVASLNN